MKKTFSHRCPEVHWEDPAVERIFSFVKNGGNYYV